jgi:ABC-type multidrug transport system ATPase subunit
MDGSNLQKSFNSLSNGQKLRIVFSILFAFLKYSEERNTAHYNILFLDEVLDSSLDTEGRIELINILRTEFQERSINIISHNQEIREAEEIFENIYTIESAGAGLGSKLTSHKEQQ